MLRQHCNIQTKPLSASFLPFSVSPTLHRRAWSHQGLGTGKVPQLWASSLNHSALCSESTTALPVLGLKPLKTGLHMALKVCSSSSWPCWHTEEQRHDSTSLSDNFYIFTNQNISNLSVSEGKTHIKLDFGLGKVWMMQEMFWTQIFTNDTS